AVAAAADGLVFLGRTAVLDLGVLAAAVGAAHVSAPAWPISPGFSGRPRYIGPSVGDDPTRTLQLGRICARPDATYPLRMSCIYRKALCEGNRLRLDARFDLGIAGLA